VFVVHGTKKFLERVKSPMAGPGDVSTTALGAWYANVLFWKPQVALFVNEATLIPVLMPLAPAATVVKRFPDELRTVLQALEVDRRFTEPELQQMDDYRLAKTNSRSVLGSMNDFASMAERGRHINPEVDLLTLSVRLAGTPCTPLRDRGVFPDIALRALVESHLT
jgi:hypothetical protein